ncbi:hypothetical protein PYCCODRAFT_582723 [Trametes coccinea BRFM310]|uniref:Uncharacterized protein n=1 Tax=Trametes coccinea (strain BRFM310) TaxID=1353009 RepID=A0A1Y2J431_TRAC3|nr:hypothetical protein PYCCODRAFT_582723 [Trametes coccinea BRFM310]
MSCMSSSVLCAIRCRVQAHQDRCAAGSAVGGLCTAPRVGTCSSRARPCEASWWLARSLVPFATCMSLLHVVGERRNTRPRGCIAGEPGERCAPHGAGHISAAPSRTILSAFWVRGLAWKCEGRRVDVKMQEWCSTVVNTSSSLVTWESAPMRAGPLRTYRGGVGIERDRPPTPTTPSVSSERVQFLPLS